MREFDAPQHLVVAGVREGLAREMGEAAEIMIDGESLKLERDRVIAIERVGREQLFLPVGRLVHATAVAHRRDEGEIEAHLLAVERPVWHDCVSTVRSWCEQCKSP